MNNYPMWWDTTITIFNRYEDAQTQLIRWYKTEIPNCFWKNNFQSFKMGEVTIKSDGIICRIPENDKFKEKQEWDAIPNDKMSKYFTLAHGDIIVRGKVDDVIDEYTSGIRSSDFLAKYKYRGCMVVDNFVINTGIGRGLPHYHVEGI